MPARQRTFGCAELARAAGLLHDIGKCARAFQDYIAALDQEARGPDHSTAGAVETLKLYPGMAGRMLAFVIAGHHAGLADGTDLEARFDKALHPYDGWEREIGGLPPLAALRPLKPLSPGPHRGFREAFLIRMLFSGLVDADVVETEPFIPDTIRQGCRKRAGGLWNRTERCNDRGVRVMAWYAHSFDGRPESGWETQRAHAARVASATAARADKFGFARVGEAAGQLHDLGKYTSAFQDHIAGRGPARTDRDHSSAGAVYARNRLGHAVGRIVAHIVAGHHAGLKDKLLGDEERLRGCGSKRRPKV